MASEASESDLKAMEEEVIRSIKSMEWSIRQLDKTIFLTPNASKRWFAQVDAQIWDLDREIAQEYRRLRRIRRQRRKLHRQIERSKVRGIRKLFVW